MARSMAADGRSDHPAPILHGFHGYRATRLQRPRLSDCLMQFSSRGRAGGEPWGFEAALRIVLAKTYAVNNTSMSASLSVARPGHIRLAEP
jgi:hypothetical protein